jgi:CRP-like cAMP-binding protein
VQTVGEGEILGWSWLFAPYRWHFDARAQQPTRALAFDGKCLRGKCDEDHDLGYAIYTRFMRIATDRLQATLLQLLDLYATSA